MSQCPLIMKSLPTEEDQNRRPSQAECNKHWGSKRIVVPIDRGGSVENVIFPLKGRQQPELIEHLLNGILNGMADR